MVSGLRAPFRVIRIAGEFIRLVVTTRGFRSSRRGPKTLASVLRLGGAFVKFGQWISVRPDFVPPDIAASLEVLQDDMPPLSARVIRRVLEIELGRPVEEIFRTFDDSPLSTASVAQVHSATLRKSGSRVAVKVQRPRIRQLFALDIAALRLLLGLIRVFDRREPTMRIDDLLDVFRQTLAREVDFLQEARNQERARRVFEQDPGIRVPRVSIELSTERLLVMEYLEGHRLRDAARFSELSLDSRKLCEILARSFFHQFFRYGYYQADPHPGNFVFMRGNVVGLLDFGIIGHFDDKLVVILMDWIRALVEQDAARLGRALFRIGTPLGPIDEFSLRTDLCEYLRMFEDMSSPLYSHRQVFAFFARILNRHRISVPSFVLFFNRTLATLDGVSRKLDPGFDWQAYWRDLFVEEGRRRTSATAVKRVMVEEYLQARDLFTDLPLRLSRLLDGIESERLRRGQGSHRRSLSFVRFGRATLLLLVSGLAIAALFFPADGGETSRITSRLLPAAVLVLMVLLLFPRPAGD